MRVRRPERPVRGYCIIRVSRPRRLVSWSIEIMTLRVGERHAVGMTSGRGRSRKAKYNGNASPSVRSREDQVRNFAEVSRRWIFY